MKRLFTRSSCLRHPASRMAGLLLSGLLLTLGTGLTNRLHAQPSAGESSVVANPARQQVNLFVTVTVTVRDDQGAPLVNVPVTVTANPRGGTKSGNTSTGGIVVFSFTSDQATTVTYTAVAQGVTIDQTARVVFTPRVFTPTTFTVTGGGSYCSGAAGVNVGLSGSEDFVTYQLYRDNVQLPEYTIPGTGTPISFGNQTIPGTYTVRAPGSSGTVTMSGSAVVSVIPSPTVSITANPSLTITQGQTTQLTASGANSYSWSSGQSTASISVSVAGPYTVTATAGSCSSVSSVVVNVTPLPCGSVVYVTPSGAGLQNGSSWSNALSGTALQEAINTAAGCGAQVWVAAGTYKPTTGNDRSISFAMRNGVTIFGGFPTTGEPGLAQRNPASFSTILSGDIGTLGDNTDNSFHVINSTGLTNTAMLDGFIISGGNANGSSPNNQGGGIYNSSGSPSLTNCNFQGNTAFQGGGMKNSNSSPSLTNCSFIGNTASQGGGMENQSNSSPSLANCSFIGNTASNTGGGMFNVGGSPSLINCSFSGNTASTGRGLGNNGSHVSLTNCVLFGNGGQNTIANGNNSVVVATYSLFEPSETTYTGENNLTTTISPFADAGSVALNACSPAINAGNPASVTVASPPYSATALPPTDLVGNPRIVGSRVDMGAVEFQDTPNTPLLITQQPPSGSAVCAGSSVIAPVSVSGTVPYTYQWYKDSFSSPVASQTTAAFSLSSVTTAQTGSYSVVITNACNSVTSTAFSLTVTPLSPDYQALVDLYNSTNGAGWINKTGWLTGCSPCNWYGVTCTSGRVTGLNLQNNNLVGTIPASLSTLTGLVNLQVGNNNGLTGGIPSGIGSLTTLQELNLSQTSLGGSIPASLGQLSQLQYLYLNQSGLTGPLPASLSNLTSVQSLILANNQLSGCFPSSYTALCGKSVVLSGNPGLPGEGNFAAFCASGAGSDAFQALATASPNPACVGSLVSLSVTAGTSYQWSGPASFTATTQTPTIPSASTASSGIYSVTVGNGSPTCRATTSVSLTVNAPPSATIAYPGSIFLTSSAPVNVTRTGTAGGTYSATPSGLSINASTGQITPASSAPANYTVTYTVPASGGCAPFSASTTLTIQPPTPTISLTPSPNPVCAGNSFTLTPSFTNIPPGEYSFQLSFSDYSIIETIVIGPNSTSTYSRTLVASLDGPQSVTASITLYGEVFSAVASLTVNVSPTPTLVSSGTITCANPSVTLTAGGGSSYVFSGPGVVSQNPTSGSALVNSGGLYSVTVTSASGCSSVTTLTVDQNTTPASVSIAPASATLTCSNPVVSLSAVGTGTYRWNTGETTPTISVSTAATYSLTVTAANGCSASASTPISLDNTSPQVSIAPASATLTCNAPTMSLSAVGSGSYRWSTGATTQTISVSVAGAYSVTLTGANGCSSTASAGVIYQNCAPTVVNAIPPQSATVGQAFSYTIPANTFTDAEPPNSLTLAVSGLPAGLSFVAPNTITGTPSTTVGSPFSVTVTATDPGGLTATTSFLLNVQPRGFAITGVTMLDCNHISYYERRINFTVSFEGTNGQPISLSVVNETRTITIDEPYQLNLFTDNPVIVFKARQQGTPGEASFAYNWLAYCANGNPRVENAIPPQSATVGQAFSYTIPANTFTDAETPTSLTLSVVGLPAGLSFVAPNTITGIASASASAFYSVTVVATDPAGGAVSTTLPFSVVNPGGCGSMFTLKAGDWNDPAVWSCGRIPVLTDAVTLNHAVSLPATYQAQALRVIYSAAGRLIFGSTSRLRLGGN
ncbi:hypothetical protein IC229_24355 [Spirosoma sp. BT702]|uniref:non-specific serine/threonine protein kinase n=1 Tax=Spirosoma profusum TaxID=2771354 RepID=A0A926Y0T7_9BACT|nr:putative Ig domain-containing protein [Spirosoma profusum]MBD2703801.1 hypothetical protein [Spirosoma profusum]